MEVGHPIEDASFYKSLSALEAAVAESRFGDADRISEGLAVTEALNPRFLALRGGVLLATGDIAGAIPLLQSAIKFGEKSPEAYLWLAGALEQSGQDPEAFRTLTEANERIPGHADINLKLASLLVAYGEAQAAISHARVAAEDSARNGAANVVLAQALTDAGKGDYAFEPLISALNDSSAAPMAASMLGYWHLARGDSSNAKLLFERSLDLEPRQALAYYGWAQGGRVTESDRPRLNEVVALAEDDTTEPLDAMYLRYVLGKGLGDLGDFGESMAQYDLANEAALRVNLHSRPFNRGRYAVQIDATISVFNTEFFRRNRGVGSSSRRPIFILGMMRSGTTLVEQIVSSHRDVAAAGELPYWLDVGFKVFDVEKRAVDLKRIGRLQAEYGQVLAGVDAGATHVTDKMPQNFQVLGLIHLAFPKAPIIHIRRHPVDTCISIYATPYQKSPDFAHSRESIVFAYRQYLRLMAHWRRVLPPQQFLEIDYEDLTVDQETVTRRILAFCKLEWDEACLRPEANDRIVTTPSLAAVRQPVNRSAVGRWRAYEPWLGVFSELS